MTKLGRKTCAVLIVACAALPVRARAEIRLETNRIEATRTFTEDVTIIASPSAKLEIGPNVTIKLTSPTCEPINLRIVAPAGVRVGAGVVIDGSGAAGQPGKDGKDNKLRSTIYDVARRDLAQWDGGNGLDGTPGCPGGNVYVEAPNIDGNMIVKVDGGAGGPGGHGGAGAQLTLVTGGNRQMVQGHRGRDGQHGPYGAAGEVVLPDRRTPREIPYSLTISGGVSEGAYEAGYNWAFVKSLRMNRSGDPMVRRSDPAQAIRTRLVSTTGASAGTVNALLTAIEWCQGDAADKLETVDSNLFWNVWGDVGIGDLLSSGSGAYGADDAILTRAALTKAESVVAQQTVQPVFDPGCRIPVGFTLTRTTPEKLEWGIDVPFARYAAVLIANAGDDKKLIFEDAVPTQDVAGQYFHFVQDAGANRPGQVKLEDVFHAVEAATAFPVAFGPKKIKHCEPSAGAHVGNCNAGEKPHEAWFFDGGVFDNLPVGLALNIVQRQKFSPEIIPADSQFMTIDADTRRHWAAISDSQEQVPRRGLSMLPGLAENFISVSRKYELQSLYRYVVHAGPTNDGFSLERLGFSTRFLPIFGENALGFGAFFSKHYRRFDYYVGIYDALYDRAISTCRETKRLELASFANSGTEFDDTSDGDRSDSECVVREVYRSVNQLGLESSSDAIFVIKSALRDELAVWRGGVAANNLFGTPLEKGEHNTIGDWLTTSDARSPVQHLSQVMRRRAQSWREAVEAGQSEVEKFNAENGFGALVAQTTAALDGVADAGNESPLEVQIDAEQKAALRALDVEKAQNSRLGAVVADVAALSAISRARLIEENFRFDPSRVPDGWWGADRAIAHVLPFSLSGRFANRDRHWQSQLELGWRPSWFPARNLGLSIPATLEWGERLGWEHSVGLGVILRTANRAQPWGVIPEVQLSIASVQHFDRFPGSSSRLRAELSTPALWQSLRIGVSRDFGENEAAWAFTLGVANINSTVYWMEKVLRDAIF